MRKFLNSVIQVSPVMVARYHYLLRGMAAAGNDPGDTRELNKYSALEHLRSVDEQQLESLGD